ncbi:MAG: dihydropyrimidinase [Anaerolineales bacterium]|nr:dihydropyrimidinase [Anaerolineales bacterium]
MSYDLVIKNGRIITAGEDFNGDIAVNGETIAAIGQNLGGSREIDASDLYVIPGAVDGHVHLQMPFADIITADSFEQGTIAAACGGVTSIIDFVEPGKGQDLVEALAWRRGEADGQVVIDYGLHMTLLDPDPLILAQVPEAYAEGCATFKLYTAYPHFYLTDDELYRALIAVAEAGGLAVVHAENYPVITEVWKRLLAEGKVEARWHPHSRPAITEAEAVNRVLAIAHLAGAPTLIFHLSCGEAAREVAHAKERGWAAFGETCPQYLTLPDDIYERQEMPGTWFICQPPIRGSAQAAALWQSLASGSIDIISTDHCPFSAEAKKLGEQNFTLTPGGISGLETRLALTHTFGVRAGHLTLNRWVEACCTLPADLHGLTHKGHLIPGYDADIVLFDPSREVTYNAENLHSNISYTPYAGITVTGMPVTTISRGEVIVENGQFIGKRGRGRFLKRRYE